jgi:diguanylate cyclase (GGDEF)-like protein
LTDHTGLVTGAIGCLSDVTDRARLRRELELRASLDGLTGCLNRSATLELLDLLLRARADTLEGLALIYIDLDDFKAVNDRYGHAAGDTVLVTAVARMQTVLRHDDRVGRLGGDEFLIVCPNVTCETAAVELSERVHASLQGTVRVDGTDIVLHATVGLTWTDGNSSADDLIARADRAMYESKTSRRRTANTTT